VAVAPIYDWTGFYIGANGGWAESRSCLDFFQTGVVTDFNDGCVKRSGGVIGGQLGYRWQMGAAVFGLEAQGDWADLKSSHVSIFDPGFITGVKMDGIGLFTGQIGYTWGAGLLYFKGGAAVTNTTASLTGLGTSSLIVAPAFTASVSTTRWGGTVGVGFEYLFTPNFSAGVEYDHLFMGDSNNSFSCASTCGNFFNDRIKQDVDMVTLRLNYKFGAPSPVVARY
jgi:outer membrane immunogenic protein